LMGWKSILDRIATAFLHGVIDVVYIVVMFLIVLPSLITSALGPYAEEALPGGTPDYWWVSIGILVGLSSAARALKGTIYSPVLRGAASLFAFFLFLSYLEGRTTISVSGISVGEASMSFSIDITPLIFAATVFILLPSIVAPLLNFLMIEVPEEE